MTTFSTSVNFDAEKGHRITSDVSQHSMGAALPQEGNMGWLPVSDASRTMTEAKKNMLN